MMGAQVPAAGPCGCVWLQEGSESSDEDLRPELLAASWDELPILERLGLSSCEEMTEEEAESAFSQVAMAFRCDQYTLPQRLQAEQHDRAVAQENLQMELNHTRDTLQLLKVRCVDGEAGEILRKMETCLKTVDVVMEDIVTAAETLGAAHQEARVSHAVELMSMHVDHLKQRHLLDSAELTETRRLLQKTRGSLLGDSTDDSDVRGLRQASQQYCTRHRVSITLIPSVAESHALEESYTKGLKASDDTGSQQPEGGSRDRSTLPDSPERSSPPPHGRHTEGSHQSQDDSSESSAVSSPAPPAAGLRHRPALAEEKGTGASMERRGSSETSEQSRPASGMPCSEPQAQGSQSFWVSASCFVIRTLTLAAVFCVVLLWCLLLMLKMQKT